MFTLSILPIALLNYTSYLSILGVYYKIRLITISLFELIFYANENFLEDPLQKQIILGTR